jgi:hypothetical protein
MIIAKQRLDKHLAIRTCNNISYVILADYNSLLGNCVGKQSQKWFSVWSVLGSSQRRMDGLDGDHVVPQL